jgi:hypothetical protein
MNEIATALSSIKTAIDLAKILKNSSTTLAEAEQKLKLAEIISALADVKIEMAEVQTLLLQKDSTINELQESLKTKENLIFEAPYYWLLDGDEKDGPFCQNCYDSENKLIRLQKWGSSSVKCFFCDKVFNLDGETGDKVAVTPVSFPRQRSNRGLLG